MPTISIIVPVYNVESYLERCINSILKQDYQDFELLLVDDGSPDKCGEMCDVAQKGDCRIKSFHKENGGLSSARNYGLDRAEGEYITFVDSDDYISENYLSYLLELFKYSDKCNITTCNRQVVKNGQLGQKFDYGKDKPLILDRKEVYKRGLYTKISHGTWARLYKKEVFNGLRFPEGMLHEDTYILGDFINRSEIMVFGPEVGYYYVSNEGSTVHTYSKSRLMGLIIATERFANMALEYDASIKNAAICKVDHAKLSVLSEIDSRMPEDKALALRIKKEVLKDKYTILSDKQNLKRDKIAVLLLVLGGIPLFNLAYGYYKKRYKNL